MWLHKKIKEAMGQINHQVSSKDTCINRLIARLQNNKQSTTISKKDRRMAIAQDLEIIP